MVDNTAILIVTMDIYLGDIEGSVKENTLKPVTGQKSSHGCGPQQFPHLCH